MRDRKERDAVEVHLSQPGLLAEGDVCDEMTRLVGREPYDASRQKQCNALPFEMAMLRVGRRRLLRQRCSC